MTYILRSLLLNPFYRDNFSYSPLHYAARGGFLSTAKCLIEKHAKIDIADKSGVSPYQFIVDECCEKPNL